MNKLPHTCQFEHECSTKASTKTWYFISAHSVYLLFMIVQTITDHDPIGSFSVTQLKTDYLMSVGQLKPGGKCTLTT